MYTFPVLPCIHVGAFYFLLGNSQFRSNIQLLLLAKYSLVAEFGIDRLLHPIVEDIQKLELVCFFYGVYRGLDTRTIHVLVYLCTLYHSLLLHTLSRISVAGRWCAICHKWKNLSFPWHSECCVG